MIAVQLVDGSWSCGSIPELPDYDATTQSVPEWLEANGYGPVWAHGVRDIAQVVLYLHDSGEAIFEFHDDGPLTLVYAANPGVRLYWRVQLAGIVDAALEYRRAEERATREELDFFAKHKHSPASPKEGCCR